MRHRVVLLAVPVITAFVVAMSLWPTLAQAPAAKKRKVQKTAAEWRKLLTPAQFAVTREKATEPAFTGKYATSHAKGTYACVCCGAELFSSQAKFDSGTGWPSFDRPIKASTIDRAPDYHTGEPRVEVMCNDCGAHLGHVFDDGPTLTGLRYCINSASLKLLPGTTTTSTKKATKSAKTVKGKAKTKAKDADTPSETTEETKTADPAKKPAEGTTTEPKTDPK